MALVLAGCADAPQRQPVLNNGSVSSEDGAPPGTEPGGAKRRGACLSLGLDKEASTPDPSIARDIVSAEKEFQRASSLFDSGDYLAALGAYQRAATADPYHGLAHLGVAESHLYTDNDHSAMQTSLTRALVLLPTNPRAHLRAGEIAVEGGEKQRAEAHLRCALELRPDYADARKRLARYLVAETRVSEAEEVIKPIGDPTTSNDVEALTLAGDVLEAQKKFVDAAARIEAAATLVKTSAPLWRRAAGLYESAGNLVAAKKARAAADKIDPPKKDRDLRPLPKARRRG